MTKQIFILSPKIKWKTFKELNDRIVKDSGITAVGMDKVLWRLLRDNKIYCYFADDMENDLGVCTEIPERYKDYKISEITNYDK